MEDILLWTTILESVSTNSINVNNVTFTSPTTTKYSDACEHGMGGYNTEELAWQWAILPELQHTASINLLEFLAAAITIYLTLKTHLGKF